jgi:electron transport complex protein RnfC
MKSVSFSGGLKLPVPKGNDLPSIEIVPLPGQDTLPHADILETDDDPPFSSLEKDLAPIRSKHIHTLIVNALDEFFVLGAQATLLATAPEGVIAGSKLLCRTLQAKQILIAVYARSTQTVHAASKAIEHSGPEIHIVPCRAKHPQHMDQCLVFSLLSQEYPADATPEDIGVHIVTAEAAYAAAKYREAGKPTEYKIITVSAPGENTPRVLWVPLGLSVHEVLDFLGQNPHCLSKIILGGPLTGQAIHSLDTPVTNDTHALGLQKKGQIYNPQHAVCCKCGLCVQACPMRLMPFFISGFAQSGHYDLAEKYDIQSCILCGCCAYVCPAGIPLVQWIKLGQSFLSSQE